MLMDINNYKSCSRCGEFLPRTGEFFHFQKDSHDGLKGECRLCANERRRSHTYKHKKASVSEPSKPLRSGRVAALPADPKKCTLCGIEKPDDAKHYQKTGRRISRICLDCLTEGKNSSPAPKEPEKKKEPGGRSQAEREAQYSAQRARYIKTIGPVPLCECGCGQEVRVHTGLRVSSTLKGHRKPVPDPGMIFRKDFVEVVHNLRSHLGLTWGQMAEIMGVSDNRFSSLVFQYKDHSQSSEEMILDLLRPFLFLEGLSGATFPPKSTGANAGDGHWTRHKGDEFVELAPLRQRIFDLKEELDTSWPKLAKFMNMDRRILQDFFDERKKMVSIERYNFFTKQIGLIQSLSTERKRELFSSEFNKPSTLDNIPREDFIRFVETFKRNFSIGTTKEVADIMGINDATLRGHLTRRGSTIRKSSYDKMITPLKEWAARKELHRNKAYSEIDVLYGVSDVAERRRQRIQEREYAS